MKDRLVFDLETDHLLYQGTRVWCMSAIDIDKGHTFHYSGPFMADGIQLLKAYRILIGHNICGFDLPFLEKNYGIVIPLEKCRDTYVMSKLLFPERGHHSLESYAPRFKMEKVEHEDFSRYTPEMKIRCDRDVEINVKLYEYLVKKMDKWSWLRSLLLEQEMHYWQAWQEVHGVDIDTDSAYSLIDTLDKRVGEIDAILKPQLPKRVKMKGGPIEAPFKKDGDYKAMVKEWWND